MADHVPSALIDELEDASPDLAIPHELPVQHTQRTNSAVKSRDFKLKRYEIRKRETLQMTWAPQNSSLARVRESQPSERSN